MISPKISVKEIIKNHYRTLVDSNSGKLSWKDFFTFYCLPFLVGALLLFIMPTSIKDSKEIINIIITTLSIFIGLFMNLAVLLIDLYNKNNQKIKQFSVDNILEEADVDERIKKNNQRKNLGLVSEIAKETMHSIFYSIFISILTIIISLFSYVNFQYLKSILLEINHDKIKFCIACISAINPIRLVEIALHLVIYYLAIHFLLVLLMIIKRFSKLVNSQID